MVWSANFAYAVGLICSDGSLSKDGRHIDFTSKDIEQIENFRKILKVNNKVRLKNSGSNRLKKYYSIQLGDVKLYRFLLSIGITANKSKTIYEVEIPDKYFIDYLRGEFDGDGYTCSFWSKEWKNSFILYLGFVSASEKYINWLRYKIFTLFGEDGHIRRGGRTAYQLYFGKYASVRLIEKIYYKPNLIYLSRKKFKIDQSLGIIHEQARVAKLVDAQD